MSAWLSLEVVTSFAPEKALVIVRAFLVSESTRFLELLLGNIELGEPGLANVYPFPAKEAALMHFDYVLLADWIVVS